MLDGLKRIYKRSVLPLEKQYAFEEFLSTSLTDTDIEGWRILAVMSDSFSLDVRCAARPMVLLIGQYSTGKTTFIRVRLLPSAVAHIMTRCLN